MATTKGQRIGIWVIAAFMAIGTIGSFAIIVLANQNGQKDQAHINELMSQYQKDSADHQAKVDVQTKQLSEQYFPVFNQYATRPAVFSQDSVNALTTEDLVAGTGSELTAESAFTAYYIGWTPDGKVFDSSIAEGTLKPPIAAAPGGVIKGWTDGVKGMKVGGVRELTIPSDHAYGATGSGESIPPNTPLKFVVMVIPTPEEIPQPEIPKELMDYYSTGRMQ